MSVSEIPGLPAIRRTQPRLPFAPSSLRWLKITTIGDAPMSSLSGKQGPRYRHLAGEAEPYETIAVEKLTPIIGAEISGVDIGKLVSDDARSNRQMDEIHRALAENLVIFFRDQHITPNQHLAFGRKFGELHIHPAHRMRATIR